MKKEIEKAIKHIEEHAFEGNHNETCPLCSYQENGTFLEGLRVALSVINGNKIKYNK